MTTAAIIALLGAILPAAITGAEKLFGKSTGAAKASTDAAKLKTVSDTVTPFLQALATAGKTPGSPLPSDIEAAIEASLAALKSVGAVSTTTPTSSSAAPAAATQSVKVSGTLTLG